ncbi:MAG: hypothetical protein NHB32_05850 [Fischerella sp. CENA71]|nr:hypothetical protein [Fischerella sp. CENA71]
MYLPIYLVRLDERTTRIYILAGQETEIEIFQKSDAQGLEPNCHGVMAKEQVNPKSKIK